MSIDIERLKVDESLWPDKANFYSELSESFLIRESDGAWFKLSDSGCQWLTSVSHKKLIPRPEPRQVEATPLNWDGEEKPEIGQQVSYKTYHGWKDSTVIGRFELWLWLDVPQIGLVTVQQVPSLVAPIRTKEQREVDEMVGDIVNHYEHPKGAEGYTNLAESLIAAGWRKEESA